MPYNLLIFPLIGGYFFINNVFFLKYKNQRIERQRLIFNSILWGILLLLISLLITHTISLAKPDFVEIFKKTTEELRLSYLGTTVLSLALGTLSPGLINCFLEEEMWLEKAIKEKGTRLEQLLLKSFQGDKYLSLNLASGKVYIGQVVTIPKPGQQYFEILPIYSGHRTTSHQLIIDNQYLDIYEKLDSFGDLTKSDLIIIIKKEEVETARIHDDNVYDFMNS